MTAALNSSTASVYTHHPVQMSLESGQLLSHYRVLSRLGAGGMGEVYLAEDLRLGRKLALKIVSARLAQDEDRLRRFQWEARSVSALNHPNVITIYDIGEADGQHFIATEFIDGETLRARVSAGPLPPALALDLVVQAARGLEAAHALGIVHRDIKPENVMIRRDGLVKVLDFGLAKLVSDDDRSLNEDVTGRFETLKGEILGTVAYMSPEQARGLLVDSRSDVFSLGVVLYEMLSGSPPFLGETPIDTLAAMLNSEPASLGHLPGVGAALDSAVRRALEKDRDRRWQSVGSFADAVREAVGAVNGLGRPRSRSTSPSRTRARRRRSVIDSLAVLPFVNATRDDELEYLGDGLTESLINNLSQIPKLRVMARGTVYRYKGRDADPQQIGRELGVKAVLSGRIVQVADRFRIAVELADAGDGSRIWGSQFTRPPSDLLLVEEEIAARDHRSAEAEHGHGRAAPAAAGGPSQRVGAGPVPEGPLFLEQAFAGRPAEGRGVFRARDCRRSQLRPGALGTGRQLRADERGLHRRAGRRPHRPRARGGRACAGARRDARRGACLTRVHQDRDSIGNGRSPSGSSARRCRSTPGTCSRVSGTGCFSPAVVDRRKRCAS